jgi:hypothetical protein
MKPKTSTQEDLVTSNFPAKTAHSFFYKNCLLNGVKNKHIEDMTGPREDIKIYFRVVKTILYERAQPVIKGKNYNITEYLT